MGIERKYWKFWLCDTPTMMAYFVNNGMVQKGNIFSGHRLELPQSPVGWNEIQLSFGRSSHYWGINRTFTIPLKFVGDGATIIRSLFYAGRGIETPITLVICKWDDVTGTYRLYYSGQLDLSKIEDQVVEGVTVNIMQGGVVQMLKAYENTVFEIPCDGSIPENIKVNCDGILLNDVFHYQILSVQSPYPGVQALPCGFVNNDGDNIGITRNNQQLELPYDGYVQKSSNFLFSSQEPLSVRIQGSISILPDWRVSNTGFFMYLVTSFSQPTGTGGSDHAVGLITPQGPTDKVNNANNKFFPVKSQLTVVGQTQFSFDATIPLSANENLFLFFFNDFAAFPLTIVGGSFTLTFSSRYRASRVWGIRPYDLGKLIIQRMNSLSSNFIQSFNFLFDSDLLKANDRYVITSGDALRASTDPNYFEFYNQATVNPTNPNNQNFTQFSSLGATIKTTISDYFDTFNALLNTSLSNQQLPGEQESVFVESKTRVLDPSTVTMTLTKIANFRVSIALEYYFNWLKIGYKPQQYDEKAGKYEYNNTSQFQAPIRTLAKTLEIISPYRADSYGVEYTRYNTQGGKSTTFNNSDNSVFILDTDFSGSTPDFYNAYFISAIPLASSNTNTDQKLIPNKYYNPVYLDQLDGEYFTSNNDFSIFHFNQPSPGSRAVLITFTCLLNGLVGDSATIIFWVNGVQTKTWSGSISGVNTPLNEAAFSTTIVFNQGDNLYFTIDTVKTCTASINDCKVSIGAGYWSAETTGPQDVTAGSSRQLISLPLVVATNVTVHGVVIPVVSSGFQYFQFLSNVHDKNFEWIFGISAYHQGGSAETFTFDVWKNGQRIGAVTGNGASNVLTWFNPPVGGFAPIQLSGAISFEVYDLVWITASNTNISTWITNCQLKFSSDSIRAYNLNRPNYSAVSGIVNAQTAFNTEITPKHMLINNGSILSPALFNQIGALVFQTSDKNQFFSTTLNGVTVTENANVDIHDLPPPLYFPLIFELDTEVPLNFADLFNNAANGHIAFSPLPGVTLYGFPLQVTAKPAFNESQTWKLLCSPKTNLLDLVNLNWDGLFPLMPFDISIPIVSPVHWVPLNLVKDTSIYKNATMDEDLYQNRIQAWIDQQNYATPRQNNEPIPVQLRTNGLSPVSVQPLNYRGIPVGSPVTITSITDPNVSSPEILFQGLVDNSLLADGIYYFLMSVGSGEATGVFISEGIDVRADWDFNTIRIDYANSRNQLGMVFSSTPGFNVRVHGQINRYAPKSKFTTFVDQPQDIDLLNAIRYDTWKLEIGRGSGVPDYLMRLMEGIFSLDSVFIDGNQYTRDADAQWEIENLPGEPKAWMTLDIRRAKNIDAITFNTSGQLTSDQQAGYVLDPTAFGGETGQPLISVS